MTPIPPTERERPRDRRLITVGRSGWLISLIRRDYQCSREVALSMLISHATMYGVAFAVDGWPSDAMMVVDSSAGLIRLFGFYYALGLRMLAPQLVPAPQCPCHGVDDDEDFEP